jgi:hypothetical protein
MAHHNVRRIMREEHGTPTVNDESINVAPQILPGNGIQLSPPCPDVHFGPICTVAYDRAIWTLKPTFAQAPGVSPIPINE